jgi:uncharacterized membrane protein
VTVALVHGVTLMAATMTAGLVAGVYGLYSHTIMPGLRASDDGTFVAAFAALDRAILNPLFMLWFFGPMVLAGAAAALFGGEGAVLPWVAAALVLSMIVVTITFAVHLPLNDALKAATGADPAAARERFHETRWVTWNLVRTILSTAAFGCLAWALVQYGTSTAAG